MPKLRHNARMLIMRKTKENLANPPKENDPEGREARETANEEHYEEIGGERSTEGVGAGFDDDTTTADANEEEKAEATADGPLSGDVNDPPMKRIEHKSHKGITPPESRSNHPAAHSPKT